MTAIYTYHYDTGRSYERVDGVDLPQVLEFTIDGDKPDAVDEYGFMFKAVKFVDAQRGIKGTVHFMYRDKSELFTPSVLGARMLEYYDGRHYTY
jgi:hypothetical protein